MIRILLTGCKWGVDQLSDGAQINILSEASDQVFLIPFEQESHLDLIVALSSNLSETQKHDVIARMMAAQDGG